MPSYSSSLRLKPNIAYSFNDIMNINDNIHHFNNNYNKNNKSDKSLLSQRKSLWASG